MSSRPVKSSKRFTFCDEFSAARRLRLPDSRRRCRRRSAFAHDAVCCPGRDVCDTRRSFEPPGEKRSFEGNPGQSRGSRSWTCLLVSVRLLPPSETRSAHIRAFSPKRGSWGKHSFPHALRRGRDLNPRRTFQHVRDFQSRSLGHSDTSPCCEAEKEGFEPSMEAFTP